MTEFPLHDRLVRHNEWATRSLLEQCRALTPEQFTKRFDIGPGSLHDTLRHIVGTMWRWADRIGDRPLRDSVEDGSEPHGVDEILALLDEASSDLALVTREVVEQGRLDEMMEVTIRGTARPYRFTRGTAIVHVYTHGIHHCAQVLNLLKRLGVKELPDIDAISCELDRS